MTESEARRNLQSIRERQAKEPIEKRFERAKKLVDVLSNLRLWGDSERSMEIGRMLQTRRMLGETEIPSECYSSLESMKLTAQYLLQEGAPLPPELSQLAAAVLADDLDGGKRVPRDRKPGRPNEGGRDGEVQHFIFLLGTRTYRLRAVRSKSAQERVKQHCAARCGDGKYGNVSNATAVGESGCDAVGLAMRLSYRACRAIWEKPGNSSRAAYNTIKAN